MKLLSTPFSQLASSVLTSLSGKRLGILADDWRSATERISRERLPFAGTRLYGKAAARVEAIVSLAVYDAVNAVLGEGEGYLYQEPAPLRSQTAAEAAAAQAAHDVLVSYFDQLDTKRELAKRLEQSLETIANVPDKAIGRLIGAAAANAVLGAWKNPAASASASQHPFAGQAGFVAIAPEEDDQKAA